MPAVVPDVKERIALFTVARPDGFQRFITDARPTNERWCDRAPGRVTPGSLLARQFQQSHHRCRSRSAAFLVAPLYVLKSALSDFYYNLRIPVLMQAWFALPAVPGWVIGRLELEKFVDLGLPMGASHAVPLAQ